MKTVKSFLQYLSDSRGYSAHTVESYRADLAAFEAFFNALDETLTWATVDRDVVRRWVVDGVEGGAAPRSVRRRLSAVRSFFRYQMLMGECRSNPAEAVHGPKCGKPLPAFLDERAMDRLLDDVAFAPDFAGQRDRYVLLLFYSTGIRLAELIGLDVDDIDLSAQTLKVTGKRNKQRLIPFGQELADATRRYLALRRQAFPAAGFPLVLGDDGLRISRSKVAVMVRKYLSAVTTMKKKSPHVLRHTFATVMLNHGADIEAVRELLGHESLATTAIYMHTTFAELKKEYELAHPWA